MDDLELKTLDLGRSRLDNFGIVLSSLCAVHCFLMPVILVVIPTLGVGFLDDGIFHPILAGSVAVIGSFAFSRGYHRHKNRLVLWIAVTGILILSFAALNTTHHLMTETVERIATLIGSSLIISAHYRNWKLLGDPQCGHCEQDSMSGS